MQVGTRCPPTQDSSSWSLFKKATIAGAIGAGVVATAWIIKSIASHTILSKEESYERFLSEVSNQFDPELLCHEFFVPSTRSATVCSKSFLRAFISEKVCPNPVQFMASFVTDFFLQNAVAVDHFSADTEREIESWFFRIRNISGLVG